MKARLSLREATPMRPHEVLCKPPSAICEKLPGGNIDDVTNALGLDTRIGRKYLTGSIGYGGPCFPRDNVALSFMARELGIEASLAETTDFTNRALAESVSKRILTMVRKEATVAVLGLSYKPFSHVTEESQGVAIARHLSKSGLRIVAFDPMSSQMDIGELRREIVVLNSVEECLGQAEAVLITTPDPVFKNLTAKDFANEWAEVLVFDFWRILRDKLEGQPNIRYVGVGISEDEVANTARLKKLWWCDADDAIGTASE